MANLELLAGSAPTRLVTTRLSGWWTSRHRCGRSRSDPALSHLQVLFPAIKGGFPLGGCNLSPGHVDLSCRHQCCHSFKIIVNNCRQFLLEQHRQTSTHGQPRQVAISPPRVPSSIRNRHLDELDPFRVIELRPQLPVDLGEPLVTQWHRGRKVVKRHTVATRVAEYTGLLQPAW